MIFILHMVYYGFPFSDWGMFVALGLAEGDAEDEPRDFKFDELSVARYLATRVPELEILTTDKGQYVIGVEISRTITGSELRSKLDAADMALNRLKQLIRTDPVVVYPEMECTYVTLELKNLEPYLINWF